METARAKKTAHAGGRVFTSLLLIALVISTCVLIIGTLTARAGANRPRCFNKTPTLTGTSGNDVLVGNAGGDVIRLGRGADRAIALSGNDRVCGGRGNDELFGGPGFDRVRGGPGYDHCVDFERTYGCEEVD